MGLNEFPPLLGEGLMIKALPGLATAVGSFVRAYGSWLTAALVRFPLAALPLDLASGLGRESSAPLPEGRAGVRARGCSLGSTTKGRGVAGQHYFGTWRLLLLLLEKHSSHKIRTSLW